MIEVERLHEERQIKLNRLRLVSRGDGEQVQGTGRKYMVSLVEGGGSSSI